MNIENINTLIARLKADAPRGKYFGMEHYCVPLNRSADDNFAPTAYQECNTVLCLAGWANLLRMMQVNPTALDNPHCFKVVISNTDGAARWLGISDQQAYPLFFMRNFGDSKSVIPGLNHLLETPLGWFDTLSNRRRYKAGIRVLEILKEDGEVDWPRALVETGVKLPNQSKNHAK